MSQFIKNLLTRNSSFNSGIKPRLLSRYESNGMGVNEFNSKETEGLDENSANVNPDQSRYNPVRSDQRHSAHTEINRRRNTLGDFKVERLSDPQMEDLSSDPQPEVQNQFSQLAKNQEFSPAVNEQIPSFGHLEAPEGMGEEVSITNNVSAGSDEPPLLRDTIFSQPISSDQPANTLSQQKSQDPVIKVSIGQIEVKATFEKKEKPAKRKSTPKPKMSLQDYMDKIKNNG